MCISVRHKRIAVEFITKDPLQGDETAFAAQEGTNTLFRLRDTLENSCRGNGQPAASDEAGSGFPFTEMYVAFRAGEDSQIRSALSDERLGLPKPLEMDIVRKLEAEWRERRKKRVTRNIVDRIPI